MMQDKYSKWILPLFLMASPLIVAMGETLQREFPEKDPFFSQPINLLKDVIYPSAAAPSLVMGAVCFLTFFMPTRKRFRIWPPSIQLVLIGVLTFLTILILLLCIMWSHMQVVWAQRSYWNLPLAPYADPKPESWILAIGFVGTLGIVSMAFHLLRKRLSGYQESAI